MSRNLKLSFVKLWFCTSRISQSPIESVRPRSFLSFGFFTVLLQEPRSRVQVLDMLMIDLLLCLFAGILSIGIGDTCQIEDFSLLGQAFSIPIQNEVELQKSCGDPLVYRQVLFLDIDAEYLIFVFISFLNSVLSCLAY
ncbi:uncharacterized protein [Euphorbia lathyris]|uniref:uncharacterized protein isoform X2 n=1 Tax=Euphorbia lathyris TaxID=212925 RepID=UPI0033142A94